MSDQYRNNEAGQSAAAMMGFVAGALVGAGIALLMAPATGQETRRRIGETTKRFREDAKGRVQHAREKLNDQVQHARETIGEIKEDARMAFQTGRETFAEGRRQRSETRDTHPEPASPTRPL